MILHPSHLILADSTRFPGVSPAWQKGQFSGEVVFNTGMTGYVETLTDPSYAGQILTFTYPSIGNYGVPARSTWESGKIHARGVVVSEACLGWSHHAGARSFLEWLKDEGVPCIMGVDTRALTKKLREGGVMAGVIDCRLKISDFRLNDDVRNDKVNLKSAICNLKFTDPNQENLIEEVTIAKKKVYGKGKYKIIAVDCGMKENIIRELRKFPYEIVRVPYDYDYTRDRFDGVFVSNGPGDPMRCTDTIAILSSAMKQKKPVFGICLGSQLLALSSGAKTYKLPYGHRGHNQPCLDIGTGQCHLTSQNHGYAVNEKSLKRGWRVNFRNLNDGSVEGVEHASLPFFSVQFHPEAAPGPTDTNWLFQRFFRLVSSRYI